MHRILLPSDRIARLRNARRYPNQAALLARLPVAGRRVPLRPYWRRRNVDPLALIRESVEGTPDIGRVQALAPSPESRRRIGEASRRVGRGARATAHRGRIAAAAVPPIAKTGGAALARAPIPLARSVRRRGSAEETGASAAPANETQALPPDDASPKRPSRARRTGMVTTLALVLGASLMYLLDPTSGRRRRALIADKSAHLRKIVTRRLPQRAEKRVRFLRGVARGVRHGAVSFVRDGHTATDDETLVDRVRSEVLRSRQFHAGEIKVEAHEGAVTLRGQLQHEGQIRELIEDTARVEGVRRVRSYLHLPGTIAPNKAEIYEMERAPFQSS